MPDEHISSTLHTHPPDPEFVDSTRAMLRAAWNEPLPQHTPPNSRPGGGGGVGHISRWMAGGAAAGLLVVAIGAIVVLGRGRTTGNTEAISTVAPTLTTLAPIAAGTVDQPVPATPPPVQATPPPTAIAVVESSTTAVPVTTSKPAVTSGTGSGGPLDSEPVQTTTTTTPVKTTPVPAPLYVRTEVPEWAYTKVSDPLSQFPNPGVYATVGASSDQTVQVAQVFVGDECVARFGKTAPNACANGYAFEHDRAPRTMSLYDGTPVIAPFRVPNEGIVWYEIPASEFANLLWTSTPDPSAPAGIELVQDWVGSYGVFVTFEGQIETLVYPGTLAMAEEG